jgi:hypothetical protein
VQPQNRRQQQRREPRKEQPATCPAADHLARIPRRDGRGPVDERRNGKVKLPPEHRAAQTAFAGRARRRRFRRRCRDRGALQVVQEIARRPVAIRGVRLQQAPDDRLDHQRHAARAALQRMAAKHHLSKHDAERIQVRPGIGRRPHQLLRRHVAGRAVQQATGGQCRQPRARNPRNAEVDDLDGSAPGDQHVLGLQVAMHDACVVRRAQRAGDLGREAERPYGVDRPLLEFLPQRPAVNEL